MGIGEQIERLLQYYKLNRLQLSEDTGVPYTTLTQIINGRTKNPQTQALIKISEYFGVTVDFILGNDENYTFPNRLSFMLHYQNRHKLGKCKPDVIFAHMEEHNPRDVERYHNIPVDEEMKKLYDVDSDSPPPRKANLTTKEAHDIAADLERIMSDLESDEALAFHGEPIDDEERELLRRSLENSLIVARQLAKKKFTPKKYRD